MTDGKIIQFRSYGHDIALSTFGSPDHVSQIIAFTQSFYELDLLEAARSIYWPGTAILDIGAFIGNHTIFFAKVLGARVYAVEPNERSAGVLKTNVENNGLTERVTIHVAAAGKAKGRGSLVAAPSNNLGQTRVQFSASGDVPVLTLDEMDIQGMVGMIKIDTEGSEVSVIVGARKVIRRFLPDIFLELSDADEFLTAATLLKREGYAPVARYCSTPTYLFQHYDRRRRIDILSKSAMRAQRSKSVPPST